MCIFPTGEVIDIPCPEFKMHSLPIQTSLDRRRAIQDNVNQATQHTSATTSADNTVHGSDAQPD